eukprot:scaffold356317_cov67-Attheya_sp.AAC.1
MAALRVSATILGPGLGLDPLDISAQSLRAAGAMALLYANVDPIRALMRCSHISPCKLPL